MVTLVKAADETGTEQKHPKLKIPNSGHRFFTC